MWGLCTDRRVESLGLRCVPPAWQEPAYEPPSHQECAGCILLTAFSLHFAPQLPHRSAISHHRGQDFSLPLSPSCSLSLWWGKNGEKLSSSSAPGVFSCGVLKNSDVMSPTSPCCKQGLISAFITATNTGQAVQAHWSVTSSCFAQYICTCACVLCLAQLFNIYLIRVEKTNLRVTGGLMQSSNRIQHVSFSHHLFPSEAGWVGSHDGQWIYRPGPPEQGGKKTTPLETRRASPAPFSTYTASDKAPNGIGMQFQHCIVWKDTLFIFNVEHRKQFFLD